MAIETVNVKKGMVLDVEGQLFRVVGTEFRKPGKGHAFMTLKLKNLRSGAIFDQRFSPSDKVEQAHVEKRPMEYLYRDASGCVFMDSETYDQITLEESFVGDDILYLLPNTPVAVQTYDGRTLGLELPSSVKLKVVETEPSIKGATAQAQNKPATMETGLKVMVPTFVAVGDVIEIDTGSGNYLTRAAR